MKMLLSDTQSLLENHFRQVAHRFREIKERISRVGKMLDVSKENLTVLELV